MTTVYDLERNLAERPADVRQAVAAAKVLLNGIGLPPRGNDGAHQVLVAFAMPQGVAIELLAFDEALDALKDPELHPFLHRAQAQLEGAAIGVVLLAVGEGGSFWCAPVGQMTGAAAGAA